MRLHWSHSSIYCLFNLNPWGHIQTKCHLTNSPSWVHTSHIYSTFTNLCVCSQEWKTVSIEEQKRLGRVRQEDGEFWWVYRNVIPATVTQLSWGPPRGCSCSSRGRYSAGMNETVTTMIKTTPIFPNRADEMIAVKKPNVSLFLNLDVPMLFKHIKYLQTKEICLAIRSVPLSLCQDVGVGLPTELRGDGGLSPDGGSRWTRLQHVAFELHYASWQLGAKYHSRRLSSRR